MFDSGVLRQIHGPKREGTMGGWGKIWTLKSCMISTLHHIYFQGGQVRYDNMSGACGMCVGKKGIVCRGLLGKPEGKSIWKKQAQVGMLILNYIVKKQDGISWTGFVWLGIEASEHSNEPCGFIQQGNCLVSRETFTFSRMTVLHGFSQPVLRLFIQVVGSFRDVLLCLQQLGRLYRGSHLLLLLSSFFLLLPCLLVHLTYPVFRCYLVRAIYRIII